MTFIIFPPEARKTFLRNIKGPVFDGLKVALLSVTHRGLDAVKAETELHGRVYSVKIPEWSAADLIEIPNKGFSALNIECSDGIRNRFVEEAQSNPFLMQKLCWEICAGVGVSARPEKPAVISDGYDLLPICKRLSHDYGHPIYSKLENGPQSRKSRLKRPLKVGGTADIYKAILMAVSATGPKPQISYDELRDKLSELLTDGLPQKNEITAALKHLAAISQREGSDAGIDWDAEERKIDISDPYLRFYLRWQIRPVAMLRPTQLDIFLYTTGKIYQSITRRLHELPTSTLSESNPRDRGKNKVFRMHIY